MVVYKITRALGGTYVAYYPDNMSALDDYIPGNYDFPKEVSKVFKAKINDLDDLIAFTSGHYARPLTLAQADEAFAHADKSLFVVDRFEDLDKSLTI